MRIGAMDQRVTLQQPQAERDGYGQETVTWQTVSTVWAQVVQLRGREYFAAAQTQQEQTIKIRLRYRADVMATWRVQWQGRNYHLDSPPIMLGRRDGLELMCNERPNHGI